MRQIRKKGMELNQSVPAVLIVSILMILVIILVYVLSTLGTGFYVDSSGSKTNETVTAVTDAVAGKNLAVAGYKDVACSVLAVTNATSPVLITASNYTISNCNIKAISGSLFNNTNWNITYTFTFSSTSTASNASQDLTDQVVNNVPIVGLVLTVIFIAIIIAILIGFGFRKAEGAI